ncbi:MAG: hypothetical protein Q7J85_01485 [Bacillota bacterium]|nr:hypothetical protein [Bacillota bacterium]
MKITLKNCNNINEGSITLNENNLNIKYAINGMGKSTIARAIISFSNDLANSTKTLTDLKPFKHLGNKDNDPEVIGCENIKSVKVFNENYINEYIFQPDELVKGSFNIFIQDENYLNGLKEINELVEDIQKMFIENKDIDDLIKDFDELSGSFGRSTKSGIHGSSNLAKAFKNGNKIENIPEELNDYKKYIQHGENYKWIKWQLDGKSFIDITENCPYCVSNIESKKENIVKISEVYDSKSVQNLNRIIEVFQNLNKYFSDSTKKIIAEFIKNIDGYSDEQVDFLREVKEQIDRLNQKFNKAKTLSFKSLKDVDKVIDELKLYKIDLKLYNHLNSENTELKSNIVNSSIDKILDKAGVLQGKINQQKKYIEKLIDKNKRSINSFLRNAGYDYSVDLLENEAGQHQLKLIHNDIKDEITDVKNHLSFGEKNAFALVLFMYDALKAQPDLIILDDPISSFDKNKKYAIIEMLFRKNDSFKDKTVLLLTHDFEPIVDMVQHHRDRFSIPFAAFLENVNGKLTEKEINRSDIQTFIEINQKNIQDLAENIQKIVYLRRLYEITNNKEMEYHIISSLLHKKDEPEVKIETDIRKMTEEEIQRGEKEIQKYIHDFNYQQLVKKIKDDSEMKRIYSTTDSNYEKLHLYRMIFEDKEQGVDSDIIGKFINEAFHLENNYIYQLNPRKYQMVPQYVIKECDGLVDAI